MQDAVFSISWFELNDKFLLIGCGNGEVSFWEIGKGKAWVAKVQGEVNAV